MGQQKRWKALLPALAVALVLGACSGAATEPAASIPTEAPPEPTTTAAEAQEEADVDSALSCEDPFEGETIRFQADFWQRTDFCQHSVPYGEIRSGGPPPDGIPPVDDPVFEGIEAADEWLGEEWPLMVVEHDGETRAYPLAILIWHEIVNDTVAGQPVAITYCPLCNAAIAFNREAPDGQVLDFGTTGNLRNLDLVMYDRQTHSWWQQFTGEAIVGEYTGTALEFLPSRMMAWEDVKSLHPEARILARESGSERYMGRYGGNPYAGYDALSNPSPLGAAAGPEGDISPMERVAAVQQGDTAIAYPFSRLAEVQVVNDDLAGTPIVVFWQSGVKSALDAGSMADSRDVGSSAVFKRTVEGQTLTFVPTDENGVYQDEETGTSWGFSGVGLEGPLAGKRLDAVIAADHFWFAWAAFLPDSEVWDPAS